MNDRMARMQTTISDMATVLLVLDLGSIRSAHDELGRFIYWRDYILDVHWGPYMIGDSDE